MQEYRFSLNLAPDEQKLWAEFDSSVRSARRNLMDRLGRHIDRLDYSAWIVIEDKTHEVIMGSELPRKKGAIERIIRNWKEAHSLGIGAPVVKKPAPAPVMQRSLKVAVLDIFEKVRVLEGTTGEATRGELVTLLRELADVARKQ